MVSTRKRPGEPGQFRQSHEKGAYPTATMSSAGKGNQWTGPVKESRSRDDAALNRMGPLRWPARTADAIAIASRTASDKVTPPRHSAQRYRGPDAWRCRLKGGPPIAGVGTWGRIGESLRRSDFPTTVSGQFWGGSRQRTRHLKMELPFSTMNWFTRTRRGIVLLGVVQGRVLEVDAVRVLIALRFHHPS